MIRSVQYLRGIAALMVLLHHVYRTMLINRGYLPDWLHNVVSTSFSAGVDIFFVISGFVIYLSIINRPKTVRQFITDRLARIVPAYWFYSSIFALIIIYYPWTHPSSSFEVVHFIKSMLFIPAQNPANSLYYPTLIVGWTLNFEMSFYVVFALALMLGTKYLHYTILLLLLGIYMSPSLFGADVFYATPRLFEFFLGVFIARIYYLHSNSFKISSSISILILLLSFNILLFVNGDILITNGIPSALIVYSVICLDGKYKNIDFLELLGASSYSLYLSHKIFICLGVIICRQYGYGFEIMAIPVILCSLLFSFLSYQYIEVVPSKAIRKMANA